jgi:hypothetical protein
VNDPNFGEQYRTRYATRAGEMIPIRIRRAAEMLDLQVRVELSEQVLRRVEEAATPSAEAARIRNGILRGTVER